ncbi:hypothetical protein JQ617_25595 [Bradyrhizobium sp. KB893862 SZCCT0404]|uniref:hypothetical protein n=1 Tax=Bradyrhizobium sp. KB893862 SZCCT0404 TaxID=2807672 RepID=UPI001BA60EA9|nr:hypothetical protein [Bradyrhizobium sp. KB893862 SZCCT0404]MBR1177353.1 hypothetical protein [Bradyrhizobium sp. KB893862 SZCCT0404]
MEDIQKRQRHIEDRAFLIDILEREGHTTLEEQARSDSSASSWRIKWSGRRACF